MMHEAVQAASDLMRSRDMSRQDLKVSQHVDSAANIFVYSLPNVNTPQSNPDSVFPDPYFHGHQKHNDHVP
jgi:hypothetical protein